jgi:hypothetical protein
MTLDLVVTKADVFNVQAQCKAKPCGVNDRMPVNADIFETHVGDPSLGVFGPELRGPQCFRVHIDIAPVDVAMLQSLVRKQTVDDRIAEYCQIIVDDCTAPSRAKTESAYLTMPTSTNPCLRGCSTVDAPPRKPASDSGTIQTEHPIAHIQLNSVNLNNGVLPPHCYATVELAFPRGYRFQPCHAIWSQA